MSYYYPRAAVQLRIVPEDYTLASVVSLQSGYTINVQAKSVTVERNDYRTADKFNLEIDYKSFPFDPRTIRALGVVIYMQDVPPDADSDGTTNDIEIGASTLVDPTISNAVFIGFADENEINFDEAGRKVSISGRDCTALLIDQKYSNKSPLNENLPLDKAIKGLLAAFPATAQIPLIVCKQTDGTNPLLPILATYRSSNGNKNGGMANTGGGKRETYWDIIMDSCDRAGMIIFMGIGQNNKGQIVPALYLTTPKNQATDVDQATGKQRTDTIDDIKIIYGQNVKNLRFKRKIGRMRGFNIMVRCRDGKNIIKALVPEGANQSWCTKYGIQRVPVRIPQLKPDGSVDQLAASQPAPYITFTYHGVQNQAALILIAQRIYEQYSLQQLEGSFETFEMVGHGTASGSESAGRNTYNSATKTYESSTIAISTKTKVFDLTQIRKGQTICIEIDPQDLAGISRLSSWDEKTEYLVQRGYDYTTANLFATTINKMSPRFQIKSYKMSMSNESGFKLSVEFQNLISFEEKNLST
jgi:hypothetical protein